MSLLEQSRVPIVVINRHLPMAPDRCVWFEQQQAVFQLIDYLVQQGHRDIACITGPINTPTAHARLAGYRQALDHHHIAYDPLRVINGDNLVSGGYQAVRELLAHGVDFSALFVSNDDMCIGAMKALLEAGKQLPQDVSLFGFDDIPSAPYLSPALSTVYLPIEEMTSAAITQALKLSEGNPVQPIAPFTGELKQRASVTKGPYAH